MPAEFMPYFSIIIPTYNRAPFLPRALASCFDQEWKDFEVVVVDDCSTDRTAEVLNAFTDSRLRVIRHGENRGVGPARNTGLAGATGVWLVCLDSDDELLPGALAAMHRDIEPLEAGIGGVRFMCRLENGETSPQPPLAGQTLDYEGFVRWAESCLDGRQETLPCVRRETFPAVRYPDGRTLESLYHFDFARRFRIRASPLLVRLYHNDAPDQIMKPQIDRTLLYAPDQARGMQLLLERHGDALASWAPRLYVQNLRGLLTLQLLAGQRVDGVRSAVRFLSRRPLAVEALAILLVGLIGPRPLAWIQTRRARWRAR